MKLKCLTMEIQVLARWERLLHVQMFNKRNLYQFLWMHNLYCVYMYIILRVSVTQSLICRCSLDDSYLFFLYCGVSYESVYVCVVVSLRPVCFSICKFWHLLKNLATYMYLSDFEYFLFTCSIYEIPPFTQNKHKCINSLLNHRFSEKENDGIIYIVCI